MQILVQSLLLCRPKK
uniref:Uncharacterized protein n=1 Tax=Anguilla anguilla TaxID=7936 RepID=A0A0E9VCH5_ANGAN